MGCAAGQCWAVATALNIASSHRRQGSKASRSGSMCVALASPQEESARSLTQREFISTHLKQ